MDLSLLHSVLYMYMGFFIFPQLLELLVWVGSCQPELAFVLTAT